MKNDIKTSAFSIGDNVKHKQTGLFGYIKEFRDCQKKAVIVSGQISFVCKLEDLIKN